MIRSEKLSYSDNRFELLLTFKELSSFKKSESNERKKFFCWVFNKLAGMKKNEQERRQGREYKVNPFWKIK